MSLMPESRHGVQALDGFALEDLTSLPVLGSGGSEAVNRAFGADNVDRYIREAFGGSSMSAVGQSGQAPTPGIGKKMLNFGGRVLRDHGAEIALGLAMIPPLAPAAGAVAAGAAVARGALVAGPRIWSAVGSRVTPVGKMMLEKISLGVEKGTSAAGSRFGFFAGRAGTKTQPQLKRLSSPRDFYLNKVENPKLHRVVDRLYRPTAKYGSGSTADAVRYELSTGKLLSPTGHITKATEARTALSNLIKGGNLSKQDYQVATWIRKDLQNSLTEQTWDKLYIGRQGITS
jgi:hypothetical protein